VRLRPDVTSTATDDGLVLLDERTGRYWQLNPTGAYVLDRLLAGLEPDGIAGELTDRYALDPGRALRDVTALAERLGTAGVVEAR
jgi:Coenzyme PQQ synthesis protein D (PqqD)